MKKQLTYTEVQTSALHGSSWAAINIVIAGMLGLMIAMGIGRFAYTPILPLMERDLHISYSMGGWLAGTNLVGYLVGAFWAFLRPQAARSHRMAAFLLTLCIMTTFAMGMTTNDTVWSLLRLSTGIASGMLFVYVTSEATERLVARGKANWAGTVYGGVGLGIALSGLLTPLLDSYGNWATAWIGFGWLAVGTTVLMLIFNAQSHQKLAKQRHEDAPQIPWKQLHCLIIAYFFEAMGYIVSATFLVTIVAQIPKISGLAPWTWVIAGIAAVPSAFFWTWLARKTSTQTALIWAYICQISGMLLCTQTTTALEVIYVGASFGGTFQGIVGLSIIEGARRSPPNGRRIAALLTTAYAIGQVIAPIVAGRIADQTSSFTIPLFMAAACAAVAIVFTLIDRNFDNSSHSQKI